MMIFWILVPGSMLDYFDSIVFCGCGCGEHGKTEAKTIECMLDLVYWEPSRRVHRCTLREGKVKCGTER